jgi:hypothetical protein
MFKRASTSDILLEEEIVHQIKVLKTHQPGSDDYAKVLESVIKLRGMQNKSSVSKDTMALIGANLAGILMIIKHERVNVITSRAMNLLMRAR